MIVFIYLLITKLRIPHRPDLTHITRLSHNDEAIGKGVSQYFVFKVFWDDGPLSIGEGNAQCPKIVAPAAYPSAIWSCETQRLSKKWLKTCDVEHETCRSTYQSGWHPTRLVYVGSTSRPVVHIRLGAEINEGDLYMTLSHCWGNLVTFKLSTSNYQQCLQQIQIEDLPKTFQDVIFITRDLGIKYIWIDSLCIIQDSIEDWTKESVAMGDVYFHSYCNIAAAAASDGNGGCLRIRDAVYPSSFKHRHQRKFHGIGRNMAYTGDLWFRRLKLSVGKGYEDRVFPFHPKGNYDFIDTRLWEHEITQSPLCNRAWVLQEIVLARRTIYFCANQLFFGCAELCACESQPQGYKAVMNEGNEPLIMSSNWSQVSLAASKNVFMGVSSVAQEDASRSSSIYIPEYLRIWTTLLDEYSTKALTEPKDKFVAISGLASRISKVNPTATYFAGIWRDEMDVENSLFLAQLLWNPNFPEYWIPDTDPTRQSLKSYIAPTWSWASVDGRISSLYLKTEKCTGTFSTLVDISVQTIGNNPFTRVTSGFLCLNGPLFRGNWYKHLTHSLISFSVDGRKVNCRLRLDPNELPPEDSVFCMPLLQLCRSHVPNGCSRCVVNGLALIAAPPGSHDGIRVGDGSDGFFAKRVGTFRNRGLWEDFLKERNLKRMVTII